MQNVFIGDRQYAVGLSWQSLDGEHGRSALQQAARRAGDGLQHGVLRQAGEEQWEVGFTQGDAKGLPSAAAVFADNYTDAAYIAALGEETYWLIMVCEGSILPETDAVGSHDEILELFQEQEQLFFDSSEVTLYLSDPLPNLDDAEVAAFEDLVEAPAPKSARVKNLLPSNAKRLGAVAVVLGVAYFGYQQWEAMQAPPEPPPEIAGDFSEPEPEPEPKPEPEPDPEPEPPEPRDIYNARVGEALSGPVPAAAVQGFLQQTRQLPRHKMGWALKQVQYRPGAVMATTWKRLDGKVEPMRQAWEGPRVVDMSPRGEDLRISLPTPDVEQRTIVNGLDHISENPAARFQLATRLQNYPSLKWQIAMGGEDEEGEEDEQESSGLLADSDQPYRVFQVRIQGQGLSTLRTMAPVLAQSVNYRLVGITLSPDQQFGWNIQGELYEVQSTD